MKIAHTVMSISRKAGGLQGIVQSLSHALGAERHSTVDVLGLADQFSIEDEPAWRPLKPRIFRTVGPGAFGYAPQMLGEMLKISPDVVHCHGLWVYPSLAALRWHARTRGPYLVSPQGMLEREVEMKNSRLKKAAALRLYQGRHLREAACLHALCEAEHRDIRAFGRRGPVCVIPNGVDLPPAVLGPAPAPWEGRIEAGRNVLLYLARITQKKGLVELLHGIALLRRRNPAKLHDWCMAVVGWGQRGHELEVKALAEELGISSSVVFVGPLFGQAKEAAYRNASAFVLPSHSEGLPLVVLEAWSYGLPVLMTPQCNIPEGVAAGAAICAEPSPTALADGLEALFGLSPAARTAMGEAGLRLVTERFTWPKVARQMYQVYEWMIGGGAPPQCVEAA
jgi:glycosyltransferase involved in cell wall biosynthesis